MKHVQYCGPTNIGRHHAKFGVYSNSKHGVPAPLLYKVQRAKFIIICYCLLYFIASWSKLWVCGRLLFGIVCSNPAGNGRMSLMSAVCCLAEVSASGV